MSINRKSTSRKSGVHPRWRGRRSRQLPNMKIRKGDMVRVILGADRGTEGEVLSVDSEKGRLTVEGVRVGRKHLAPTQADQEGQIIDYLLSVDVSNVAVVCPRTGEAGRVGFRFEGDKKVRYHRKSGEELP